VAERKDKKAPEERPRPGLVISPAIVVDIVKREALNTAGVVQIASGSFIGRGKGVNVSEVDYEDQPAYKIEIYLQVEYGTNCHKLAEVLSERVTRTVQQMTKRKVLKVTIHVEGIRERVHGTDVDDSDPTLDF